MDVFCYVIFVIRNVWNNEEQWGKSAVGYAQASVEELCCFQVNRK